MNRTQPHHYAPLGRQLTRRAAALITDCGKISSANGANNELSLAELAENARNLPSKTWRAGVASIAAALVAALVAITLATTDR
jgi:hypothetical protein